MSDPPPGATSPDDFVPPPAEDLPPVPDDAGDSRGYHFRRLLGKPLTWILGGAPALIAFVSVAAAGYVAIGGAVAAVVLLVTVLIVYLLARGSPRPTSFAPTRRAASFAGLGARKPAPGDAAAAARRRSLHAADAPRGAARRDGRHARPLHLRGGDARLRRHQADELLPLHHRDDQSARGCALHA